MKRTTTKALAIALFASLAFSGAVSAKGHDARGTHATTHGPSGQQGAGATATSLTIKGNASHPGGVFRVLAVLHAAKDLRPPTVDAIVHFASGDVPAVLTRSGQGAAYHAAVPVPAAEPAGVVLIDATATVDGTVLTATGQGKIVIDTRTNPPAPLAAPTASCTPAPSDSTEPSESPDASQAPDASESADPSDTNDQSGSADPSDSAEPSDTPEPSESADPSDSGEQSTGDQTSGTADPCASDAPTVTTTFTLPADLMAQVVAFVESLLG
jgi:hypothetical protein